MTVIIPTYNRLKTLFQGLESLQEQTCDNFEIIVVDNLAHRRVEEAISDFNATAKIPVRYVPESQLGLHHARHAGVKSSESDLLVFTDDDASFSPEWLDAYRDAFEKHPSMVAAGGPVRPIWESTPPEWLLEYIGGAKTFPILSLMEPYETFSLGPDGFFFGVNMAIRKPVFQWTGFHPELIGGRTVGDGETGLNDDLKKRELLIGYVPEAVVFHHIPEQRMRLNYIRKWAWHLGGANMFARLHGRRLCLKKIVSEGLKVFFRHSPWWLLGLLVQNKATPFSIDLQFRTSRFFCELTYLWWTVSDPSVREILEQKDFRP